MAARGPYAKGLAKRDEILDVAREVYAQFGYDRTSLREIARRSGLTQAGLQHHFSSKEELFLELLRRRDDDSLPPEDASGPSHSVDVLMAAVERNEGERDLVRLFVNMSTEGLEPGTPTQSFFEDRYAWLRSEIAADVREKQARGGFPSGYEPDDVAAILLAAADGLQLQWLLDANTPMSARLHLLWDMLQRLPAVDAQTAAENV